MDEERQQKTTGGNEGNPHPSAGLYNEDYFRTHFAIEPYGRESAHWMGFFSRVADFIVQTFRPRRVLDAGCAMGLLVEALRDRGVEAFGLDISDYALSKVREDLKPFCRKASVTDPLVEDYDLITCIEVLEHVTEKEAGAAIRQFAAHAPLILFSSTSRDFTEPTHVNVQSIPYWVKAFGREALHPDLATDAGVVCPHALVFSRQPNSPNDLLSFITRSFDWAVDLNELRIKTAEETGNLVEELEQVRSAAGEAQERVRVLEGDLASLTSHLQEIESLQREEGGAKERALRILKEERGDKERIRELLRQERQAKALALQAARQEQQARESALKEAEGLKRRTGELERTLSAERATNEELRNHIDLIHTSRGWKWLERFRRAKLRLLAGWKGPGSLLFAPIALARRVRKNYAFLGSQSWLDTLPFHDRKSDLSVDDWIRWIGPITIASQTRNALLMHPVSTTSFRIELPRRARLYFSMGLLPGCWHKNVSGVVFRVNVKDEAGNIQASARRFVHPSGRIADRRWMDARLDLSHLSGLKVVLELSAEVPENGSALHAWSIWGDPVITSVPTLSRALWRLRSEVGASGVSRTIYRLLLSPRFQDRDPEYYRWISETEPAEEDLRQQREESGRLNCQPLVSLILPVHRIPVWILEETIQSVVNQTYPNWELSIAGGELSRKVSRCVESHASRDPRIKFNWLPRNLGISGNSNAALRPAQGEFVALLDHDDLLAPFALFEIVRRLNEDPELDLLYSDKDMLSPGGRRFQPLFKPRWSPAMMLSANYLTHLTVLRRRIVEEIGGFRSEMDGSQDWDLFLRFVERTSRIERVPKVLYHWRVVPTSVARSIGAKPYALAAQERTVQEHLERTGRSCSVVRCGPYLQVRWKLDRLPRLSVIVPGGGAPELARFLETVLAQSDYPDFEVLVVYSGRPGHSPLDLPAAITNDPKLRILRYDGEPTFSRIHNWAAQHATGEVLVLASHRSEARSHDWLRELAGWAMQPSVGVVGPKLLRPDGTLRHCGMVLGLRGFAGALLDGCPNHWFGMFGDTDWYRDLLAVSGECFAVRSELFRRVGGFDETIDHGASDVDFCLRIRDAGYSVVYTPFAELVTHELAPGEDDSAPRDYTITVPRHDQWLRLGDPFFSPNVSSASSVPRLRQRDESAGNPPPKPLTPPTPAPRVRTPLDRYSQDASYLALDLDFSAEDVSQCQETLCTAGKLGSLGSVTWLLPGFHHAYYGGIHTILRFACSFLEKRGVETQFAIVGTREIAPYRDRIIEAFPPLRRAHYYPIWGMEALEHMRQTEAGVATLWNTAYWLLKLPGAKRKFYFLQDFEPLFYPAGSTSAQAEATYRFGFFGIANTVGIQSIYESEYGGIAEHFDPCVDTAVFYPSVSPPVATPQVFFYGRPDHPRNAFELASAAVRRIKEQCGKRVRIVSAGSEWSPEDYGLGGIVENFGLLSIGQTAEMYRSSTVGLLLMFTRHPSYIPFELMACGCAVVTNQNQATRWFFEDKVNCVVAAPSATCLSQAVVELLNDDKRRGGIVAAAQTRIKERHSDWEAQIEKIYHFMCDPMEGRHSQARIAPISQNSG